jgi:hypothetical protein
MYDVTVYDINANYEIRSKHIVREVSVMDGERVSFRAGAEMGRPLKLEIPRNSRYDREQ